MGLPERPLLVSPPPIKQKFRAPPSIGDGAKNPKKARQIERLNPKFAALQEALEAKRGALQSDPSGPTLEQVLVFETNGPAKDLYETVAQMKGLEWLADEELRDLDPDEDFFIVKKPRRKKAPSQITHPKQLTAQLYLVLFNQEALEQLLSLWSFWRSGHLPKEFRSWRAVFSQLRDIRRWGVQDRLRETRILEYWRDRVAAGYETVTIEIELWFRSLAKRTAAHARLVDHVSRMRGQVLATCVVEPIAYHAVVARLPIHAVEQLLKNPEVELLKCDDVRLVRPTGQAGEPIVEEAAEHEPEGAPAAIALPVGEPVVALLDGLPLENHSRLTGRLVVDDPDGWAEKYPVGSRCHGTAMASLILHGDLGAGNEPAARPLYVRPILRPSAFDGKSETAPEDGSWVDLIHRAVRRIVRGEANQPAAAPRVRVINLSIGDPYQPFIRTMSPLAKLLDWLAWTYQVLFIVSAGNHQAPIEIAADTSGEEAEAVIAALAEHQRFRRILSPAEAVNALTVGATQEDASGPYLARAPGEHTFTLPEGFPSPISGLGRGYRRMVKPEVLTAGGRVAFTRAAARDSSAVTHTLLIRPRFPPGHRVAAPGAFQGDAAGVRYTSGTSNSAALTSRLAAELVDVLSDLSSEANAEELAKVPMALWLKTLIVHGATWEPRAVSMLRRVLRTDSNKSNFADEISAILGFGRISPGRVVGCAPERVTMLAGGSITADERYVHVLPLPGSLNAHVAWRRLTLTMSWFTPINPTHQRYRRAFLWFEPPVTPNTLAVKRAGVDWRAVKRGTVQHEVLEGDRTAINIGPNAVLELPVSCMAEAGHFEERIPYAIAVTLEVAPGVNTRIYDEVRARIVQRVAVRA
jgi:hypothetical protein